MLRRSLALMLGCSLSGCFYDFSLPTEEGALDGAGEADVGLDATVDDGGPRESARSDATVDDGGPRADARSDAPVGILGTDAAGGDASVDRCELVRDLDTVLCDRFERSYAFHPGLYQAYTGSPRIVREGAPYVLETDAASGSQEWLDRQLERTVSRVALAFTMNVLAWPETGERQIMPLRFQLEGGGEARVYLRLYSGSPRRIALVEEYPTGNDRTTPHFFEPPGAGYHQYRIDVDLEADHAQIWVDGIEQLPPAEPFPQLEKYSAGNRLSLLVGAAYPDEGAATTLRFQEVLLAVD